MALPSNLPRNNPVEYVTPGERGMARHGSSISLTHGFRSGGRRSKRRRQKKQKNMETIYCTCGGVVNMVKKRYTIIAEIIVPPKRLTLPITLAPCPQNG